MAELYEIRANFDRDIITMYQAYDDRIADAAIKAQRFVSPFSMRRMTWIKPSFLWLMHRSQWAKKKNQTRILAVNISRSGFEEALSHAVLTEYVSGVHSSREAWRQAFESAKVHVQWDPERSLQGKALDHYSIQVGIGRHMIETFVHDWITSIEDITPLVKKIRDQSRSGKSKHVRKILPSERVYPVDPSLGAHLQLC